MNPLAVDWNWASFSLIETNEEFSGPTLADDEALLIPTPFRRLVESI